MEKRVYITIDHLDDLFGPVYLRIGDELRIKKEHDNCYDDEAIAVFKKENKCAYVANSVRTVARGTFSAGRIYDLIGEEGECVVRFILEDKAIAEVLKG
jgi:hypothetical protein